MNEEKQKTNSSVNDDLTLPRRGFLQRAALLSGVFLTGVLRLKKAQALHTDEFQTHDYKCCTLFDTHDPTCTPSRCVSSLFWTCPHTDGVIYVCAECYMGIMERKEHSYFKVAAMEGYVQWWNVRERCILEIQITRIFNIRE